jgi:prolyl 4-hydroxylase
MDEKELHVVNKKPLIFYIDNALTIDECNLIIEKSKDKMERARIGTGENADISKIRTGSSYFLNYLEDEDIFPIYKKIAMLLNKPGRNFDTFIQVIHYLSGEEYKTHVDPSPLRNEREGIKHRKFTCLCYLNDINDSGGETEFPELNIKISPKMGRMVYFDNYHNDGKINYKSKHRSNPVINGEKWAFNLWYHLR